MTTDSPDDVTLELKSVDLPARWRALLLRAGFLSCAEILLVSPALLVKRTSLTDVEVDELLSIVSWAVVEGSRSVPVPVSNVDLESKAFATTGDEGIDRLLGGGLRVGSVTEIAGQPSSGKSHFCLQASLCVQLPCGEGGFEGGVIFLSSEGSVPTPRLITLAQTIAPKTNGRTEWDMLDNVHIIKAGDTATIHSLLQYVVPARIDEVKRHADLHEAMQHEDQVLVEGHERKPPLPIKLIVFDSVGAPFRVSHDSNSRGFAGRAREMGMLGDRLHQLARRYSLAVLVVNQVSDVFTDHPLIPNDTSTLSSPSSAATAAAAGMTAPVELYNRFQSPFLTGQLESGGSAAALGMTWTNVVNARLMATKTQRRVPASQAEERGRPDDAGKTLRTLSVVFSPFAPKARLDYVIDHEGLRSV